MAIVQCSWNSRAPLLAQSHELLMALDSKGLEEIDRCNTQWQLLCSELITDTQILCSQFFKKWEPN